MMADLMITKAYRTVTCASVFLIICVFAFGQERATDSSVVGTWEGTLAPGAAKFRLVLHIDAPKDGPLVGRLDSPDQGATDLPIDSLSFADNTLSFEMKSLGASYQGKIDAGGNQITG